MRVTLNLVSMRLKRFLEKASWPALRSFIWFFSRLPRKKAVKLMKVTFSPFISKRKKIALENIKLAKVDVDESVAEESIENFIESIWEILRYGWDHLVKESFVLKESEAFENLKGKGVIAVGLHLGNFPLMCAALNDMGYKIYPVMRRVHNAPLGNFIDTLAREYGVEVIYDKPRVKATGMILKRLKEGAIVFLAMDQTASKEDPMIPFFGIPVPTFKGPVVLHYRTGLPVVPLYTYREEGKNIIVVEEPIDGNFTGSVEKDLEIINKKLEDIIKKHPENWFWFHRRWKRARFPSSF